jgi:hypothetical protein
VRGNPARFVRKNRGVRGNLTHLQNIDAPIV